MKFRLKITVCMVWLFAAAFGIGGSLIISASYRNDLAHEKESAISAYQMTVNTLQLVNSVSVQTDFTDIAGTLRQIQRQATWSAVQLKMPNGEVPYESGAVEYFTSGQGYPMTIVTAPDNQYFLQLSGSLSANQKKLNLNFLYDISRVFQTRKEQEAAYRNVFLGLIVFGGVLSWSISYFLTKPLAELSNAARRMAAGDLSVRVKAKGRDDVGQLSRDFNTMAARLQQNMEEITAAMEQQEQFMGSFAHELKTPMTSIIGYADLLRQDVLPPEDAMSASNYIFSEGRRLEALSLKLLDLLMMDTQNLSLPLSDPSRPALALVHQLRPIYAQQGITLKAVCASGQCPLEADLFKSLLANLLDNARKSIEGSGAIYVSMTWQEGQCRLQVLDNGQGIPPDALEHLTEAFYRVDKSRSRKQGGVGLGLTLCQRIVALHHGSLSFSSVEGVGTCVTVWLGGGEV